MNRMRTVYFLALYVPSALVYSQVEHRTDWPKIANLQKTLSINTNAEDIYRAIPITDRGGKLLYTLFCRGGSDAFLDRLSDSSEINYVGPLCFMLVEGNRITEDYNLLCEDGSAQWYSRGQLHSYGDIISPCGSYPEYGNLRHFRLRAFELTLQFLNFVLRLDGSLLTFDVHIDVHSDSTATSSIAEQTGYLPPVDSSCTNVIKGNMPRMWRNKQGNWIEEKDLLKQK